MNAPLPLPLAEPDAVATDAEICRWYDSAAWRRRSKLQLKREPLCCYCARRGITKAARVSDHIIPHRGNPVLFWQGKLQSLCKHCHDVHKQREEVRGYSDELDQDGWPSDPRHPANAHGSPSQPRGGPIPPGQISGAARSATGRPISLAEPQNEQ